jgi:hypothetical protein
VKVKDLIGERVSARFSDPHMRNEYPQPLYETRGRRWARRLLPAHPLPHPARGPTSVGVGHLLQGLPATDRSAMEVGRAPDPLQEAPALQLSSPPPGARACRRARPATRIG